MTQIDLEIEGALRSVSMGLALLSKDGGFLTEYEHRLWLDLRLALAEWLSCEERVGASSDNLLSAYVALESNAIINLKEDWEEVAEGEVLTDWLLGLILNRRHPYLVECERLEPSSVSPLLIDLFCRDLRGLEALVGPKWKNIVKKKCNELWGSDWESEKHYKGPNSSLRDEKRSLLARMEREGNWAGFWKEIGAFVHKHYLPPFRQVKAFSIRREPVVGLHAIRVFDEFELELLEGNEARIEVLKKNTHYFLQGHKAHNVLIWGPRGGGKSSLVRGLIGRFAEEGLRAIEIVPEDYSFLPEVFDIVRNRPEKFIGVLDNISLDRGDPALRQLSRVFEGGLTAMPDNLVFYATSNYKDLVDREGEKRQGLGVMQMDEDGGARALQRKRPDFYDPQQHQRLDELRALDDRFGLKVYVDILRREEYESVLLSYASRAGIDCPREELLQAFKQWSMRHNHDLVGGRTARDFIRYYLWEQLD